METREEIQRHRKWMKQQYRGLYESISEILFRHDPVQINFGDNIDEYEPEVETILPRLKDCSSAQDVRHVVHQEFIRWFTTDAGEV